MPEHISKIDRPRKRPRTASAASPDAPAMEGISLERYAEDSSGIDLPDGELLSELAAPSITLPQSPVEQLPIQLQRIDAQHPQPSLDAQTLLSPLSHLPSPTPPPASSSLAPTSPSAIRAPVSLSDLPNELLQAVAHNTPSARSLLAVNRRTAAALTGHTSIWRNIASMSPPFTKPLVESPPHKKIAQPEREATIMAYNKRLTAAYIYGNEGDLGQIRNLALTPLRGSLPRTLQLLEDVSPNLESLAVVIPHGATYDPGYAAFDGLLEWNKTALETGPGLALPNLRSLFLGRWSFQCPMIIPLLCQLAPNLDSLYLSLDRAHKHGMYPRRYLSEGTTRLRTLGLDFGIKGPPHAASACEGLQDQCLVVNELLGLLEYSPSVQQVSVSFTPDAETDPKRSGFLDKKSCGYAGLAMSVIEEHKGLRDLHCAQVLSAAVESPRGKASLPSVRRLATCHGNWIMIYLTSGCLPIAPNLETIYFEPLSDKHVAKFESSLTPLMPTGLVEFLRTSPKLDKIHFLPNVHNPTPNTPFIFPKLDRIDQAGNHTGSVRSYRHCGSEILHLRLRVQLAYGVKDNQAYRKRIIYTGDGDQAVYTKYIKGLTGVGEPEWQNWTEYEGKTVPMGVLEEMRVVEGMERAEWERRGVEVGEAAWKVLLDWRERDRREGRALAAWMVLLEWKPKSAKGN